MKRLENITLDAVARYLRAQDWAEFRDFWPDVVLWRRPDEEKSFAEIVLPKRKDERYAAYLLDAARAAADFEQTTVDEILFKWKRPDVDRVRYRIVSDKVEFGATPLDFIQTFVDGVVSTLRVAVQDVVKPEPYHKRVRSTEVDELMRTAEFGQTERGSFIVNLFVPVGRPKDVGSFDETKELIFRRGLEHLTTALDAAIQSVESGDSDRFLERDESRNISGNLFDAVETARCDDDAEIEITVDWSPLVKPSPNVPNRVYLKRDYSEYFRNWSQARRPKDKNSLAREFVARVVDLSGDEQDDDNHPFGTVKLLIFDSERNFEAQAFLPPKEYKIAYDAHYEPKYVAFDGECVWNKRKATMESIANFHKVEIPNDAGD